jgi:hypothetical protein
MLSKARHMTFVRPSLKMLYTQPEQGKEWGRESKEPFLTNAIIRVGTPLITNQEFLFPTYL